MALTDQELLLLDNFMYYSGSVDVESGYTTLGELIDDYKRNPDLVNEATLSGGFETEEGIENFQNILAEIDSNDKLRDLKLGPVTNPATDKLVRGRCFIECDEAGNEISTVVAFRGTGGSVAAWKDNFEGLYLEETQAQNIAKDYIEQLGMTDLTVTGHSKGGNFAMYVTAMCGDQVERCVSFDGQGFGPDFFSSISAEQLKEVSEKIKSVNAHNDFVSILLTPIAGEILYVENEGILADGHSPYDLYTSNKGELALTDGMFTEEIAVSQDSLMNGAHNWLEDFVKDLPEDEKVLFGDVAGNLVSQFIARDANWGNTLESLGSDVKEYGAEKWEDVKDFAADKWEDAKDFAAETLADAKEGLSEIGEGISDFFADAKEDLSELGDGISDWLRDAKDDLSELGEDVSEWFADAKLDLSEAKDGLSEFLGDALDNGKIVLKEGVDGALYVAEEAGKAVGNLVDGAGNLAKKGLKELSEIFER